MELRTGKLQLQAVQWGQRAAALPVYLSGVFQQAVQQTLQASKTKHFYEDRTGRLRRAHKTKPISATNGKLRSGVFVDLGMAPHGVFQYWGTKAHGPVTAPRLVFFSHKLGRWVSTTWVQGIKADPWISDQATQEGGPFFGTMEQGAERALGGVFK